MVLADGNAATVTQLYAGGSRLQSLSTSLWFFVISLTTKQSPVTMSINVVQSVTRF